MEVTNLRSVTGLFRLWSKLSEQEKKTICQTVVAVFESTPARPETIAQLVEALVASGERWTWPAHFRPCLDVPSTGGPCSLTTLLCPYLLAGAGFYVPKLGVPGTTAGAIDVLALMPSFRDSLDHNTMLETLVQSRVAHSLPHAQLTPADGFLFRFRKGSGKKSLAPLVIASILAKKLAVSCEAGAVDVRCGPMGNMGTTMAECESNAALFASTARLLGLRISCVLTDSKRASMNYVGRSESLAAFYTILTQSATGRSLTDHCDLCVQIASEAALAGGRADGLRTVRNSLLNGSAEASFLANLIAQGSSVGQLNEALGAFRSSQRIPILAKQHGYLNGVAFDRIARAINIVNKDHDDRVGVEILKDTGDFLAAGESVALLRVTAGIGRSEVHKLVNECSESFDLGDKPAVLSSETGVLSTIRSWE
jgi:pyrimidine-nucleoside phosphorylase